MIAIEKDTIAIGGGRLFQQGEASHHEIDPNEDTEYFQLWAIMNKGVINIPIQVFSWIYGFLM